MRDPELLISLLKQMSESDMGWIPLDKHYGMDSEEQKRYHHIQILMDAEFAVQVGDHARITNSGYDFLNASKVQKFRNKLKELTDEGMSFSAAIKAAMMWLDKILGS